MRALLICSTVLAASACATVDPPIPIDAYEGSDIFEAAQQLESELGEKCDLSRRRKSGEVLADCGPLTGRRSFRLREGLFVGTDLETALSILKPRAIWLGASALNCSAESVSVGIGASHVQIAGCGGMRDYSASCDGEIHEWSPEPSADPPIPFGEGMSRPEGLCHPNLRMSPQFLERGKTGLVIAKCVVTAEGFTERCTLVKELEFANAFVLGHIYGSRFVPAKVDGQPVAVEYVFNYKLVRPAPSSPVRWDPSQR